MAFFSLMLHELALVGSDQREMCNHSSGKRGCMECKLERKQRDSGSRLLKDKFRKKWLLGGRLKRPSRHRCDSKREGWNEGRRGWRKPKQRLLLRLSA